MTVSAPEADPAIWIPPIHKTVATEGKGIDKVAESIAKHAAHLRQSGDWDARDRARLGSEMEALLQQSLMDRFLEELPQNQYDETIEKVLRRDISPYEAVQSLLNGNAK